MSLKRIADALVVPVFRLPDTLNFSNISAEDAEAFRRIYNQAIGR